MTPLSHISLIPPIRALLLGFGFFAGMASFLNAEGHWAFQAILRPEIKNYSEGEINPIDAFVHEKLREADLTQNARADRHTLLRRVTLDLTGLPPTRGEIADFIHDESDDAWNTVVDRLLASPHYGERWGRHWLDVARYVQGTIKVPGIDRIDLAEPYRDYVVRSFNEDKPYDRFIAEQLAGDLLAAENESPEAYFDRITAPAFLSIGQWYEECTDPNKLHLDIIDEQISTATRAFLAIDFACIRCHDSKYDPIPIEDYYALAGIFNSTEITSSFAEEWKDGRPRLIRELLTSDQKEAVTDHERKLQELRLEHHRLLRELSSTVEKTNLISKVETPLEEILHFEAEDFSGHKNLKTIAIEGGEAVTSRRQKDQWVKYRIMIPEDGKYTLLARYQAFPPAPVQFEIEGDIEDSPVFPDFTFGGFRWVPIALPELEKGSFHFRFLVAPNQPFPTLDAFKLVRGEVNQSSLEWQVFIGEPSLSQLGDFLSEKALKRLEASEQVLKDHLASAPHFTPTVSARDGRIADLPVHSSGDVYRTEGDPIPRGNPSIGADLITTAFTVPENESGRVQFAEWLSHPHHPLTSRVMVNRIWHWHFGTGLVRTVDDFGRQGAEPTHPELLDWLAAEFIESGWSIKHLHRLILTSETYRLSSRETAENIQKDPDGALLSRYPSRRLEVEALYDGMTTSIGKVQRQPAGEALDPQLSKDRALYILTSARSPVGLGLEIRKMFNLFGFDDSGRPMHDRDESLTPQQSLFWLNNPLPRYYAEKLANQLIESHSDPDKRLAALYETLLGRPPNPVAREASNAYLEDLQAQPEVDETEAWTRIALGLFSTRSYSHIE